MKGYIRKGNLELVMKDYDAALVTYGNGLKVDPANAELKDGERKAIYALNQVPLTRAAVKAIKSGKSVYGTDFSHSIGGLFVHSVCP